MSDTPARLAAALADRYRFERELGQGGMAELVAQATARLMSLKRRVGQKPVRPGPEGVLEGGCSHEQRVLHR